MKYVVLCDYGLDDAVATAYLLDKRGGAAVDIVPVGGNSPTRVAFRNAGTLLAGYRGSLEGVRVVDTRGVAQPFSRLPKIHGEDGMGDLFDPAPAPVPVVGFKEWLGEDFGEYVLVSLGPCTVTALILAAKPAPAKLLIMGGNIAEEPNYEGREFNHGLDVEAFARCVRFPHEVATLDSCRQPRFNLAGRRAEDVAAELGVPKNALFVALLGRAIQLAGARHPDNCYVYDHIAVRSLFEPRLFGLQKRTDPDGNILSVLT